MTANPGVLLVLAVVTFAIPGAGASSAQTTASPRGAATSDSGDQALDFTISLAAAYDSDISAQAATGVSHLFAPESIGQSNQLLGSAAYQWRARDVQIRADGTSVWVHNRHNGLVNRLSDTGAVSVTARLPGRSTLVVNQTLTHSPSPLYTLLPRTTVTAPGEAPLAGSDYGMNDFSSYGYGTQATLTHNVTRRTSVSLSAMGERSETVDRRTTATQSELGSYSVSGTFTRLLSRNTTSTSRYSRRVGTFPTANIVSALSPTLGQGLRIEEQTLDIGMVHARPLTASRQLVFDVALGGGVLTPVDQQPGSTQLGTTYRLLGQAGAAYVFAKTWQLGATYRRGVDYVSGLTEPVLTDGIAGRVGGSVTRHVEILVAGAIASGTSALTPGAPTFDTYTSNARVRVALTPAISGYVEYLYYLYDFRRYAAFSSAMPSAFERNGIRAGLTVLVHTLGR